MRNSWTVFRLGCFILVFFSCATPVAAQKLFIKNYTTTTGLLSNDVAKIAQDAAGQMWFGTSRGLQSYDGVHFLLEWMSTGSSEVVHSAWQSPNADTVLFGAESGLLFARTKTLGPISLLGSSNQSGPGGEVTAVLIDGQDRLWAGIKGRGLLVVPSARSLVETAGRNNAAFDSVLAASYRYKLKGRTISALVSTSRGSILVGTDRGTIEVPGGNWSLARNPLRSAWRGRVNAIAETRSGDVWIGTEGDGIFVLHRGLVRHYTKRDGLPENSITSIAEDLDGGIWIGTPSRGICVFSQSAFSTWSAIDGLASPRVRSLFVDREGNLWVATDNGVSKVLRHRYETFDRIPELRNLEYHCVMKDRRGKLWFGITGGVVRYDGSRFRVFRSDGTFKDRSVVQVFEDSRGGLWLNGGRALSRFALPEFHVLTDSNLTEGNPLAYMYEDSKGKLWTASFLALYEVRSNKLEQVLRFPARCFDFTVDREGGLWISGNEGTWRYDGHSLQRITDSGGPMFASSDGKVWIVNSHGVSYSVPTRDSAVHVLGNAQPVLGDWSYVGGFEDRQHRKWFLTNQSIQSLTPDGLRMVQMTAVPLWSQRTFEDDEGYFWILSYAGIIRFNTATRSFCFSSALANLVGGTAARVDWSPNTTIAATDDEGNKWFATHRSIIKLNHEEMYGVEPRVFISGIDLGTALILPSHWSWLGEKNEEVSKKNAFFRYWYTEERSSADFKFDDGDTLRILGDYSQVEFQFNAISFADEGDVRYQHRLAGVDSAWSLLDNEPRATYWNLKDGVYAFYVHAVDGNGNISDDRRLTLIVASPFWKTTWFWIYAVITLMYTGTRVYQRRINRLRLRHREDTERAVLNNEMQMARKIQLGMLPMDTPKGKGFEIAARSIPAREVGGDFYDFAEVDDEVYTIAVGDVSGHGLTGAMIVGMARTSLRFAMKSLKKPGDILTLANTRLYDDIKRNLFVAVFFCKLDFSSRTFTYTNAGQVMPLLWRKGKAKFLPYSSGDRFPLGIIPRSRYREESIRLQKGDVVLLYTDGIVEAMNEKKEEFGFDRLLQTLERLAHKDAGEIVEGVLASVGSFTGEVEKQDDLTLVVLKAV